MTAIALIPARGGSKRIPSKNIRLLNGHPLIAYTIAAAKQSQCFEKILVSSDDTETLDIAASYGADCIRRPEHFATDTSPDIEWVTHALDATSKVAEYDTFSILRPTSPFRMPSTIKRAFDEWNKPHDLRDPLHVQFYSSLRAVELVSQHPGKMFYMRPTELVPVHPQPPHPLHDSQMASLPPVWVQNASLEIAWVSTVKETGTISGGRMLPFLTEGYEGFDLNTEQDWLLAEQMVVDGVPLPDVS